MEWNKSKKIDWAYIFTVPNILCYFRIALIIPMLVCFFTGRAMNYDERFTIASAVCLVVSGLSDFFDGFLARKLNQRTELGIMLDPIADKLTLVAVGICITFLEPYLFPVICLLIVKDLLMLVGGSYMLKHHVKPFASKWFGKVGTFSFYISVVAIVVFYMILDMRVQFQLYAFILIGITTVMMIYSLIRYFLIFLDIMRAEKAKKETE